MRSELLGEFIGDESSGTFSKARAHECARDCRRRRDIGGARFLILEVRGDWFPADLLVVGKLYEGCRREGELIYGTEVSSVGTGETLGGAK